MPENSKKAFERLSTDVRPLNYAIRLKPDLEKLTFEGSEEISLQVRIVCSNEDRVIYVAQNRSIGD